MPTDERVLVIPTPHLLAVGGFHGFRPADDEYRTKLLDPRQFSFRPRSEVETDPTFKQLIPYVVFRCRGQVFHYTRGSAGTEARLTAKRSVGIGGHIAEADAETGDAYQTGMLRELHEEVEVVGSPGPAIGFINDDRTPVGQVHLGVVHICELTTPTVQAREAAIAAAGFAPVSVLAADTERFETWSQFVLEQLSRGLL
jgi:predicted NUDIX family phosphoesterase